MSKRKVGKPIGKKKVDEGPKFSVYLKKNDIQVYPGKGVPEKEAQRLSDNLIAETYIKEREESPKE